MVHILVKLLSPPIPTAFTEPGNASRLISHMPILGSILFGVSRVEVVHIFSLYGMVSRHYFVKHMFLYSFHFPYFYICPLPFNLNQNFCKIEDVVNLCVPLSS